MAINTLDKRLSETLLKLVKIPCNKEYGKFNAFKCEGGNGITILNIPPNVKVFFNFIDRYDTRIPLDYMTRGWRFSEIGTEGLTKLYDNFFIYTEGTDKNDEIILAISSAESNVLPMLSSNTNQIDQVDAVGKIGTINTLNLVKSLSPTVIAQIAKAVQGIYYKPPIHSIKIQGEISYVGGSEKKRFAIFPLGYESNVNKISTLNLKNDKYYKIELLGHFDIGRNEDGEGEETANYYSAISAHFAICNINNGATITKATTIGEKNEVIEFDNCYKLNKRPWADEKKDVFDIIGIKYLEHKWTPGREDFFVAFENKGINKIPPLILKGEIINSYQQLGIFVNFLVNGAYLGNCHSSIILNIYEMETYDSLITQ